MISPLFRMEGDEARGLSDSSRSNKIQLRKDPSMPSVRQLISREGQVRLYDPKEHWKTYREIVDEAGRDGVAYGDCEDTGGCCGSGKIRFGTALDLFPTLTVLDRSLSRGDGCSVVGCWKIFDGRYESKFASRLWWLANGGRGPSHRQIRSSRSVSSRGHGIFRVRS